MKYRKKPIIIEAEQYFFDKLPWPAGVLQGQPYGISSGNILKGLVYIDTLGRPSPCY